jgi:hypothetical protein
MSPYFLHKGSVSTRTKNRKQNSLSTEKTANESIVVIPVTRKSPIADASFLDVVKLSEEQNIYLMSILSLPINRVWQVKLPTVNRYMDQQYIDQFLKLENHA